MNKYSRIVVPDLTRQLVATSFLPVDAQDAAITHAAPPWLAISQVGGLVENSIFDPDCGSGTGCILDLHIAVDRRAFSIWGWELDLPWKDPNFQWLPEPRGSKFPENMYQIPGCKGLEYPPGVVINHRHLLQRGHILEGLLLGHSFAPIPDSYHHGANIDARLVIIDEMGLSFSTQVELWVNRIARIDRKPAKPKTRQPIFEKQDWAEDELVPK